MSAYWVLKTEPTSYSYTDLERDGSTVWDGVRNSAALKQMRAMQPGDMVLIYHTGTERQAVGIAEVTSTPYVDPDYEPLPDRKNPTEPLVVDVRAIRRLVRPVTLAVMKADPYFADFALVRQGRLSVVPVTPEQWTRLLAMAAG
jgi:predicted RNA-binding protein with PUA-like domain